MQAAFRDGMLAKDFKWQTVVLIPKGTSRDFMSIGLVEVLWKTVASQRSDLFVHNGAV